MTSLQWGQKYKFLYFIVFAFPGAEFLKNFAEFYKILREFLKFPRVSFYKLWVKNVSFSSKTIPSVFDFWLEFLENFVKKTCNTFSKTYKKKQCYLSWWEISYFVFVSFLLSLAYFGYFFVSKFSVLWKFWSQFRKIFVK